MRMFIGVDVGESLRARMGEQITRLRRIAPAARWIHPDSAHLTLAFLGEVDGRLVPQLDQMLDDLSQRHPPLTLSASGSGTFGSMDRPRVLWVTLGQQIQGLFDLQADLTEKLRAFELAPDFAKFEPHLTLARSRHPQGDVSLARCAQALQGVAVGTLEVTEVALFSSHTDLRGMHYSTEAKHPLRGRKAGPR